MNKDIDLKNGIYIESIEEKSPAYGSELKVGDIITKIGETQINKMSDLQEYLY